MNGRNARLSRKNPTKPLGIRTAPRSIKTVGETGIQDVMHHRVLAFFTALVKIHPLVTQ